MGYLVSGQSRSGVGVDIFSSESESLKNPRFHSSCASPQSARFGDIVIRATAFYRVWRHSRHVRYHTSLPKFDDNRVLYCSLQSCPVVSTDTSRSVHCVPLNSSRLGDISACILHGLVMLTFAPMHSPRIDDINGFRRKTVSPSFFSAITPYGLDQSVSNLYAVSFNPGTDFRKHNRSPKHKT